LTPPGKAVGMKHREFAFSPLVPSWPNPLMKVAQAKLADDDSALLKLMYISSSKCVRRNLLSSQLWHSLCQCEAGIEL